MNPDGSAVTDRVVSSSKYSPVDRRVVDRIVADAITRFGPKRAEQETRRLLHQTWGLYYSGANIHRSPPDDLANTLKLHRSTLERLPFIESFYGQILARTGRPRTIIDYACGLNPLAFASLNLDLPDSYIAKDIDHFTVDTLQTWFGRLHISDRFKAGIGDLLTDSPEPADVVLLLKTLPVLEMQQKGSGRKILANLPARYVVVSYPLKSVSGREKGMATFYRQQFLTTVDGLDMAHEELLFPSEMVFILTLRSSLK